MTLTKQRRPADHEAPPNPSTKTVTQTPDTAELLHKALRYASVQWPVFPCHWTAAGKCSCGDPECGPAGKHPLTRNGVKDASTDPAVIETWWRRWPCANVAIATGGTAPDVVDFDTKAGKPGRATYERLRRAGLLVGCHTTITTPSGGFHLYYLGSGQGNGAIAAHGVDFRSTGGYVLAPPSAIHGIGYVVAGWRNHFEADVHGVDWSAIRRFLIPPPAPRSPRASSDAGDDHAELIRWMAAQPEGGRNNALHWAACRALETGASPRVLDDLADAAVSAGLPRREADRTVASAQRGAHR